MWEKKVLLLLRGNAIDQEVPLPATLDSSYMCHLLCSAAVLLCCAAAGTGWCAVLCVLLVISVQLNIFT